jgi:hypothetical protein
MKTARIEIEFELDVPEKANRQSSLPSGRIPRLSRLMALAIKCHGSVARGEVRDFADLARVGHVTRARMSQIMNLANLAPDIQEEILFLPMTTEGRAPVTETAVRRIACQPLWNRQRAQWSRLHPPCQTGNSVLFSSD